MKHQRIFIATTVALAVGSLLFYELYAGGTVPAGQRPLVRLNSSNFSELSEDFNHSAGSVRLLVLLSPT